MKKPDWKCVFTYVQSYYRRFRFGREKASPTRTLFIERPKRETEEEAKNTVRKADKTVVMVAEVTNTTNYVALKRSNNNSQIVLGRTGNLPASSRYEVTEAGIGIRGTPTVEYVMKEKPLVKPFKNFKNFEIPPLPKTRFPQTAGCVGGGAGVNKRNPMQKQYSLDPSLFTTPYSFPTGNLTPPSSPAAGAALTATVAPLFMSPLYRSASPNTTKKQQHPSTSPGFPPYFSPATPPSHPASPNAVINSLLFTQSPLATSPNGPQQRSPSSTPPWTNALADRSAPFQRRIVLRLPSPHRVQPSAAAVASPQSSSPVFFTPLSSPIPSPASSRGRFVRQASLPSMPRSRPPPPSPVA